MTLRALLLAALTYVLLLTTIAFAVPFSRVLGDRVGREVRTQALAEAQLVADTAASDPPGRSMQALVSSAARTTRGRVIIVGPDGRLRYDSARPAGVASVDYSSRPEIERALRGEQTQEQRESATLDRPLLVTAVPITEAGRNTGAVRVSQDVGAIERAVGRARLALLGVGLLVLTLGVAAAAILARVLTRPLVALEQAAARVADGDMTAVAPERGSREQVAVAQAFNTMTGRLDRTLTAQQQFVGNASHQLRTPLTGVRLRLEEALAERPDPAVEDHLLAATAEVDRLSEMIDDLLLLSRSGERPQSGRPVDLARLAADVADRLRPTAARAGREVLVRATAPATVLADRGDLERILDALTENALAYGAGPIELIVDGARVEVADRGPGLAPGEADGRLLERFQRGSAGRASSGTGLGLSIATALAARWGGSISLRDRPGGGALAALDLTGAT